MAEEFKEGDVVVLKSDGPKMTYDGDDTIGRAICTWFDDKNQVITKTFNKNSIKKYVAPSRSL